MNQQNDPLFSLADRLILVTGGTRGIGAAITRRLAGAGARVLAGYLRAEGAANEFAAQLAAENLKVELCRADLSRPGGIEQLVTALGDRKLHGIVHAAATGVHGRAEDLTGRHWDFTFAINTRGFLELMHALVPHLERGATVVALSSEGAVHAVPEYALVGASKAALESLCRHYAVELADRAIRVNVLSPGAVATDVWKALPHAEERLAAARARHPQGRLTTLEEVSAAAWFLCSDASSGVNGHTLVVDGGARIRDAVLARPPAAPEPT